MGDTAIYVILAVVAVVLAVIGFLTVLIRTDSTLVFSYSSESLQNPHT